MNFIVVGTDHRFQRREPGLCGLLRALLGQRYVVEFGAIAEELHEDIGGPTIAQLLAKRYKLCWYNLDMTMVEKQEAGIWKEQKSRPTLCAATTVWRVPSDGLREDAWVAKLIASPSCNTLVICGYLHLEALAKRLTAGGCTVDKRVYLETVPTIQLMEPTAGCVNSRS
jgi:hypothetical protein